MTAITEKKRPVFLQEHRAIRWALVMNYFAAGCAGAMLSFLKPTIRFSQ
jgi:hypothetical protein